MAQPNEYPNAKVSEVIYRSGGTSGFKKNDWLDLAMAALDQAGLTADKQKQIASMLSEHYDTE